MHVFVVLTSAPLPCERCAVYVHVCVRCGLISAYLQPLLSGTSVLWDVPGEIMTERQLAAVVLWLRWLICCGAREVFRCGGT